MKPIELKVDHNFDLSDKDARRYLNQKNIKPSFSWDDVLPEEHHSAFTVAKMMQIDLLKDTQSLVQNAIDTGISFDEFKKELIPQLKKRGWWGKQTIAGKTVQLGSDARLRTIFDTNMRTARAQGQWMRAQRTKSMLPYFQYLKSSAATKDPAHLKYVNTVLPIDDPWWTWYFPPSRYGCKCSVRQITKLEADSVGINKAPAIQYRDYTNKSGVKMRIPADIHPAFASSPANRLLELDEALGNKIQDSLLPFSDKIAEYKRLGISHLRDAIEKSGVNIDELVFINTKTRKSSAKASMQSAKIIQDAFLADYRNKILTGNNLSIKQSSGTIHTLMTRAAALFPSDWVDKLNGSHRINAVHSQERGFMYANTKGESYKTITISKVKFDELMPTDIAISARDLRSSVHELSHAIQYAMPDLNDIFIAEHVRRTSGDALEKLKDIYPDASFMPTELTRKDHYVNSYMGREYTGNPAEVMSMALESGLINVREFNNMLINDQDMLSLIMGLLYYYRAL